WDENDLFGALLWDDTMMGVINAAGEKCATLNPVTNELELTLYTPTTVSMIAKYMETILNREVSFTYQRNFWDGVKANEMFENNQSLFFLQLMKLVTEMRAMETDFGVMDLLRNFNPNFTSFYERGEARAQRDLERINEAFAEFD
ncbi:MAG: hypothetical protein FWD23_16360, partial [Oscillospiraceae bacterium]|nr:hypothetical protein [Oscillospiraceae bacterium]